MQKEDVQMVQEAVKKRSLVPGTGNPEATGSVGKRVNSMEEKWPIDSGKTTDSQKNEHRRDSFPSQADPLTKRLRWVQTTCTLFSKHFVF